MKMEILNGVIKSWSKTIKLKVGLSWISVIKFQTLKRAILSQAQEHLQIQVQWLEASLLWAQLSKEAATAVINILDTGKKSDFTLTSTFIENNWPLPVKLIHH